MPALTTAVNPLDRLAPEAVDTEWAALGLDRLSDDELFTHAAEVIAVPRAAPATSFVLHAPLELLARRALLQYVAPGAREAARRRVAWIAASFAAAGPAMEPGEPAVAEGLGEATSCAGR